MRATVIIVCLLFAYLFGYAQKDCIVRGKLNGADDGVTLMFLKSDGRLLETDSSLFAIH